MEQGWRTVVAGNGEHLSLHNGCLMVEGEKPASVPLCQIREIVLERPRGTVSLALLSALGDYHIQVLLCDERSSPRCELSYVPTHHNAAGNIHTQSRWTDSGKGRVWKRIVEDKIRMQERLLRRLGLTVPEELRQCRKSVLPGDSGSREGQAARLYFNRLFDTGFHRRTEDDRNAALNYGYAILRSSMSRILTLHGYYPALGLWHHSETNRFNLSCDLMEPFRPLVDEIVYHNREKAWDRPCRCRMVEVLRGTVRLDQRRVELPQAMEAYALDVLASLGKDGNGTIKEVDFL